MSRIYVCFFFRHQTIKIRLLFQFLFAQLYFHVGKYKKTYATTVRLFVVHFYLSASLFFVWICHSSKKVFGICNFFLFFISHTEHGLDQFLFFRFYFFVISCLFFIFRLIMTMGRNLIMELLPGAFYFQIVFPACAQNECFISNKLCVSMKEVQSTECESQISFAATNRNTTE